MASQFIQALTSRGRTRLRKEYPSDCFGTCVGSLNLAQYCWVAKGPVQRLFYSEIKDKLLAHLDGWFGSVSSADGITLTLYMIGTSHRTASPIILFICKDTSYSKEARKFIKAVGILKEYPGFRTGHVMEDPGWGAELVQLASDEEMASNMRPLQPVEEVFYDRTTPLRATGMTIFVRHGSSMRPATGNLIQTHGRSFYLTAGHAFFEGSKLKPQSLGQDDDFEIDSDSEADYDDELDAMITSIGSQSPDAWSDDNESVNYSVQDYLSEQSSYCSFSTPTFDASQGSGTTPALFSFEQASDRLLPFVKREADYSSREIVVPPANLLSLVGKLAVWSVDKDWALIDITEVWNSQVSSLLSDSASGLSDAPLAMYPSENARIFACTSSGDRMTGVVAGSPSFTRVPHGKSFQEVFPIKFDGPLANGDCGSVVLDATTGEILGHIVAGCRQTGFAYVMAAHHVFPELLLSVEDLPGATNKQVASLMAITIAQPAEYCQIGPYEIDSYTTDSENTQTATKEDRPKAANPSGNGPEQKYGRLWTAASYSGPDTSFFGQSKETYKLHQLLEGIRTTASTLSGRSSIDGEHALEILDDPFNDMCLTKANSTIQQRSSPPFQRWWESTADWLSLSTYRNNLVYSSLNIHTSLPGVKSCKCSLQYINKVDQSNPVPRKGRRKGFSTQVDEGRPQNARVNAVCLPCRVQKGGSRSTVPIGQACMAFMEAKTDRAIAGGGVNMSKVSVCLIFTASNGNSLINLAQRPIRRIDDMPQKENGSMWNPTYSSYANWKEGIAPESPNVVQLQRPANEFDHLISQMYALQRDEPQSPGTTNRLEIALPDTEVELITSTVPNPEIVPDQELSAINATEISPDQELTATNVQPTRVVITQKFVYRGLDPVLDAALTWCQRPIGHPADSQFQPGSSSIRPQHQAGLDVHPAPSNENEKSHQNDIRSSRPDEAGSGLIQKALPYSVSDSGRTANAASYYGPLGINNPDAALQQHTTDSSFVRPWKENGNLLGLGPGNIRASEGSVSEAPHSLTNVTAESDSFWASDGASFVSQNPRYPYKGGNLEPGTPATPQTGRYLHPSSSSASYRDASRGSHSLGNRKRRASSLSAGNVSRQLSRGGMPAGFRRANSQRSTQDHSQGDNDFGERPWACPLAQKCGDSSHRCYGWTFADVSRVKQHLNRDHASEITEDQFKKISVRMPTKEVESWNKIFRILFPENEQLPSPFFNAQFDVQHRISPESLRDHLLSRVEDLDHMSSEQIEGVRRFIAETSHTFLHQASHDSRHDPKEPSAHYGLGSGPQQQGSQGNIQHSSQSFEKHTEAYPSVLPDEVSRGGLLGGVGDGNVMLSG
ncbi:nicotinamide N-methyltransferase [Pochonia chlamydosporia 170]|uniref:Nicotinamide N-methyltransferase n=1 Tax=Pochonia chlamydosporia 170 TaxID=1380566 RepID=A0A179EY05_METCM|nr:nicotinamide N-methyltransferase [Pochonia chlamydosporia 170]OAQ58071.1 nicotinamide N-methyltransferase [Pochonia chlamydosporia 170]